MHTEVILGVSLAAVSLLVAALGYLIKGLVGRVKDCEDACGMLGTKFATLQAHHDGTAKAIDNMRKALDDWQRDIREQIGKVHDRINDLAKK